MRAREFRYRRLAAQRLLPGTEVHDPVEATRWIGALQSQDAPASLLSVRARTTGLTASGVQVAREDRSLVRTWAMRGTLHLMAADDFGWLMPLVAPPAVPSQHRWFRNSGHDVDVDAWLAKAVDVLEANDPMTRHELAERIDRPGEGPFAAGLARLGSQMGLVCCGPERRHESTYVGVQRWLGRRATRRVPEPLAELARRYLRGHGPATPEDLATWAGIGLLQAREGFEAVRDETEEAGDGLWALRDSVDPPDGRFVRLIPRWDSALLGWKGRDLLVPPRIAPKVFPGGGMLFATVLVDGVAAGTWTLQRGRVSVDWAGGEPRGVKRALAAEEDDVLRFLG